MWFFIATGIIGFLIMSGAMVPLLMDDFRSIRGEGITSAEKSRNLDIGWLGFAIGGFIMIVSLGLGAGLSFYEMESCRDRTKNGTFDERMSCYD